MSTNKQRLTRSIQRIAETAPGIRKLIDDAENKGGKPGAAGVGGGAGSEEGSNTTKETSICCDGSVGDPNPGVEERDPTDGDQDGLNPDDPADLSGLDGGCLTGVTNCDTGDPICFCGDDFIPPDDWTDPDDPPIDPGWEEGWYWRGTNNAGTTSYFFTCSDAKAHATIGIPCYPTQASPECQPAPYSFGESGQLCFPDTETYSYSVISISCSDTPSELCVGPEDAPRAEEWPTDGCVNLAIKGGTIVGSKYDPENDGTYSAPISEIQLCDGANQISLKPSGSSPGGWKTIDAINPGDGYLYNKNHEQIARISGDEYSDPLV